jgi:hypothetical protein
VLLKRLQIRVLFRWHSDYFTVYFYFSQTGGHIWPYFPLVTAVQCCSLAVLCDNPVSTWFLYPHRLLRNSSTGRKAEHRARISKRLRSSAIGSLESISGLHKLLQMRALSQNFLTFKEPQNRFQGIKSANISSLAGRYDNSIPWLPYLLFPNQAYLNVFARSLSAVSATPFKVLLNQLNTFITKITFCGWYNAVLRIRIRKDPKLLAGSGSDLEPK